MTHDPTRLRHLAHGGDAAAATEYMRHLERLGMRWCVVPTAPKLLATGFNFDGTREAARAYVEAALLGYWPSAREHLAFALHHSWREPRHVRVAIVGSPIIGEDGPLGDAWLGDDGALVFVQAFGSPVPSTHTFHSQPIPMPSAPLALAPCSLRAFAETPAERAAAEGGRCYALAR